MARLRQQSRSERSGDSTRRCISRTLSTPGRVRHTRGDSICSVGSASMTSSSSRKAKYARADESARRMEVGASPLSFSE